MNKRITIIVAAILLAGTTAVKAKVNHDNEVPTETGLWENISILGSNSSQEVILDNILGLNVVEYNMKSMLNENDLILLSEEQKEAYLKREKEMQEQRHIGLLAKELRAVFPQVVYDLQDGSVGISYTELVPVLVSCIQELKTQLDLRTEKLVDVLTARGAGSAAVNEVRAAIGNSLLSAAPSSVDEPAQVRYVLADNTANAYIAITDMGGRVMTKVPVSPASTSVAIDSGVLGEGIFLCTMFVNGENIGTKRLVKTK